MIVAVTQDRILRNALALLMRQKTGFISVSVRIYIGYVGSDKRSSCMKKASFLKLNLHTTREIEFVKQPINVTLKA